MSEAEQTIPTRLQLKQADRIVRRFARDAVKGRRDYAMRFYAAGLAMIDAAVDCGIGNARLYDMAARLHDELSILSAGMSRDLDERGLLDEWQPIDLADLDALLVRLS
jgi:hypothetical protein